MSLGSGRCFSHPDRAGLGICVECRNVICVECTTQFEGINRCSSCLAKRLEAVRTVALRSEWSVGSIVLALMSLGVVFGVFFFIATLIAA